MISSLSLRDEALRLAVRDMIDRGVSTACLVPSTPISSNARVDAVRAEPRKNGGGRSGGSLGLGYLAAGRPLHPICPRSVQGKWELEGDNRRFRPRGAAGAQPRTDKGGPPEGRRGASGGIPESRSETRSPSASPLITRNRLVLCGACAPAGLLRGGNSSDAAVPSPRPSLRWLRSEANPLPRSAPDLASGPIVVRASGLHSGPPGRSPPPRAGGTPAPQQQPRTPPSAAGSRFVAPPWPE